LVGRDKRQFIKWNFFLEESFNKFLDRSHIPDDVEVLKDLVQSCCKKFMVLEETIEYLQSQLSVLKRFQYGQRSERLKKKR
jgi:hypothetical protein